MRRIIKYLLGAILISAAVLAALGLWHRDRVVRLMAVNSLFSEDRIVSNFSNMDTMFETVRMPLGDGEVTALPPGKPMTLPEGADAWIDERAVTALVVLRRGEMVHESYHLDTGPNDLRISWSVAKSFLSALLGIVLDEGQIESIDDPVTKYAPGLKDGAYDRATIRNVLQMSSGVTFDEDYLDFWSDINKMGRVLAMGGSMDAFARDLKERFAEPGETWQYVSIDTHVLGMVIRGATGREIADLMQEKLLVPMGLEAGPYYVTDGFGVAFVLGGLNLMTRDYARMGQMFLDGGKLGGRQIVPRDWVLESTQPSAPTAEGQQGYGYQWWMAPDAPAGEFFGRGIYGQYVYVNRPMGVVIAMNSADRQFREAGVNDRNIAMFRLIAGAANREE